MAQNDEIIQLILKTQGVEGLRSLASEAEKAAGSLDKAGKSGANMGQSLLQGGRAIQDFAQGGIGGVLNNIEGLASALGLGAGVAGAATAIGVAVAVGGPAILKFFKDLGDNKDPMKSIKERLEEVGKALEELGKKTKKTNEETKEFNKLAKEQGELQKKAAEDKAKEAAMSKQPKGEKQDKEMGERVSDVLAGHQEEVTGAVAHELGGGDETDRKHPVDKKFDTARNRDLAERAVGGDMEAADKLHSTNGLPHDQYLNLLRRAHKRAGTHDQADKMVTDAMGGDVAAARKLVNTLPKGQTRDDLVRATISDRTKDEARFQAGQFLDNTIGKPVRAFRDRNDAAKAAKAAHENNMEIDAFTNDAMSDRDSEQKRADAETMRFREQARREQASKAEEAQRQAEQERFEQFHDDVKGVANEAGIPMTHQQTLKAAQHAASASLAGTDTDEALMQGISRSMQTSQAAMMRYQAISAQMRQMNQRMMPPVMSDTGF